MSLSTNSQPDEQFHIELGLPQLPVGDEAAYLNTLADLGEQFALKNKNIFLFDSAKAASEIAWIIRGEWDERNSVRVDHPDEAAIDFAAKQLEAEYCRAGEYCYLPSSVQHFVVVGKTRSGKSTLTEEYILQALSEELSVMSSFNSPKTEALSDHIEARELDPHLHYHYYLDINLLRNRSQEQEP